MQEACFTWSKLRQGVVSCVLPLNKGGIQLRLNGYPHYSVHGHAVNSPISHYESPMRRDAKAISGSNGMSVSQGVDQTLAETKDESRKWRSNQN